MRKSNSETDRQIQPLNLLDTELSGTHLIEAGAGTGKTYTITGLYLRLLLEKKFTVDRILVVTFTKAATEELKDRIRRVLMESRQALGSGRAKHAFIKGLMARIDDAGEAAARVQDALRDFDSAAIYTIHGFCHRLLYEHAFETGDLFDTELVSDQSAILLSIAEDFWRRRFYEAPPEFISYALKKQHGPPYFYGLMQRAAHPMIQIIPDIEAPALHHLKSFRSELAEIKRAWWGCRREVEALLKDPSLSGVVYGSMKPDAQRPQHTRRDIKIMQMQAEMDQFAHGNSLGIPLCPSFEKFTAAKIKQAVRKGCSVPFHPFFDLCETFQQTEMHLESEMALLLVYLRSDCLAFAERELHLRKKDRSVQFFDDLLGLVFQALTSKNGQVLASRLRAKYQAALVDEFQDTDRVQFEIFSRIFSHKDGLLFMIGDPKQSIYSFRGADVFSYMKASSSAESKHTLLTNYRSDPGLVQAVNTIFSRVEKPFVFDEIAFESGTPFKKADEEKTHEGKPFKLWWMTAGENRAPIPKEDAVHRIARAVAAEISRCVNDRRSPFSSGDIAVLVRTNRQASVIKSCLADNRVPSVLYSAGNVFDTREALALERVLKGIANPRNKSLFKAALVTEILGVPAEKLDPEMIDVRWWEETLEKFMSYRQTWHTNGFIRMFSMLLNREKVRSRLLSFADGERRLTDLLHLSEIIHATAMEKNLGVEGLIKWFSIQRDPRSPRLEAHQLRLESDSVAVKIVTIHKSKGLEYPVVFCPFAWSGSKIRGTDIVFHDTTAEKKIILDVGSSEFEEHRILAQNELLAENLRLLYVALTRAQQMCYLVWGRISSVETSALAYLLHNGAASECPSALTDLTGVTGKTFLKKNDDALWGDLKALEIQSKGAIEVTQMPAAEAVEPAVQDSPACAHELKQFSGRIDTSWRISSYSSLISGRSPDDEMPDRDEYAVVPGDEAAVVHATAEDNRQRDVGDSAGQTIFSFPKGAAAGIFFHDVLEHLDFSSENSTIQRELVAGKLKEHGFADTWQDSVMEMIQQVRKAPLASDQADFTLAGISSEKRMNEVEFYFPLLNVNPERIKTVFADNAVKASLMNFSQQLDRLVFAPARGFMKGYIDMLFEYRHKFYIVDWKSNFLGPAITDYEKDVLAKEMERSFYILQYHLYTLAVHLLLKMRKPDYRYDQDFGGIFYVFIRGVNARLGPGYGIFSDRPATDMVDALGKTLIPGYDAGG